MNRNNKLIPLAIASSIKSTTQKRPTAVALAEHFRSQIFYTDIWDHVFLSDKVPRFPILPRELSFVPTLIFWKDHKQINGDDKLVAFIETSVNSTVILGMRKEMLDGTEYWYPNSACFEVHILDIRKATECGASMLVIPPIKVWQKDSPPV